MPAPPNRPTRLLKPAASGRSSGGGKPVEKSLLDQVLDLASGRRQPGFYNSKSKYPTKPRPRVPKRK